MAATGQNIELHQGDTRQVIFTVKDTDGNVFDLTGFTSITWVVYKQTSKVAVLTKTYGSGITVPTPANGQIVVDLLPSDTESLASAIYNHECEISSGPNDVYTVSTGTLKLLYSKA